MIKYELPELDYAYDALEPHISGEIMELYHSRHHANYVNGANATLEKLVAVHESGDFAAVTGLSEGLASNLGGHTNHPLFWKLLSPNGGGQPTDELAEVIEHDFGSFEKLQAHFNVTALGLQDSGWAVLGYDTIAERLVTEQTTDQQDNLSTNLKPALLLDMWEYVFYLQHKNVKADYAEVAWNVFNRDYATEPFVAVE